MKPITPPRCGFTAIEDIVLDSININTTLIISLRIIPTPFAGYAGLWGGI